MWVNKIFFCTFALVHSKKKAFNLGSSTFENININLNHKTEL